MGVRAILEAESLLQIVSTTHEIGAAVRASGRYYPDGILFDASITDDPVEVAVERLRKSSPASKILLIADEADPLSSGALTNQAVRGCLSWSDITQESICAVVTDVLERGLWVGSPFAIATVVEASISQASEFPTDFFTENEERVIDRLDEGLKEKDIAAVEPMSPRTVYRTVASLHDKLDAPTAYMLGRKIARIRPEK
jgi:DNA-binding NarL/FixJ family response regulator